MWGKTRIKFLVAAVAILSAVTLLAPRAASAVEAIVTDVRVGPQSGSTRVVFELTGALPFQVFTLGNPYRVVIDLPEVGWRLPPKPLPRAIGIFETLRYGLYKPGNSRVVIDLKGPAAVRNAFLLKPSSGHRHRIVVDLGAVSRTQFGSFVKSPPIHVAVTDQRDAPKAAKSVKTAAVRKPAVERSRAVKVAAGDTAAASRYQLPPRKPALRPRQGRKDEYVIIIDPGHGGPDPGTIGTTGTYEKHVTLAMARELRRQIEKTGRYKVVLTRDRDVFVRLRDRVRIAREAEGDLFLSLHADAVKNSRISGPSVYTLSENASDKEAAALAEKENKSDLIAGVDLTNESRQVTNILIDLAQRESMNQSARFANNLIGYLKKQTRTLRNTHRFAGFAVLKAPDIPSILLEMGFLSNRRDENALKSKSYRRRFAQAITMAIDKYFSRIEEASRL